MTVGAVSSVEAIDQGAELVADALAGDTVLYLDIVSDFNEDGGTLGLIDPVTGVLVALEYDATDPDAETITLAEPLDFGADTGDFAQAFDDGGKFPAVEWIANVAVDEGDPLPATIPTALIPAFFEGSYDSAVTTEVQLAGPEYRVTSQPQTQASFDGAVLWNPRLKMDAGGTAVCINETWTNTDTFTVVEGDGFNTYGPWTFEVAIPGTYLVLWRATFPANDVGRRGAEITVQYAGDSTFTTIELMVSAAEPFGQTHVAVFDSMRLGVGDLLSVGTYQSSGNSMVLHGGNLSVFRTSS